MPDTHVLATLSPSTTAVPNAERPGVNIAMGGSGAVSISETWSVAGWNLRFVRLGPGEALSLAGLDGAVHLKVVTGTLSEPALTAYAEPLAVRTTKVEADQITAGAEGVLVAVFVETSDVPDNITSMEQLTFAGPLADKLTWQSFDDAYGQFTDMFKGKDAHMAPGFHLLDTDDVESGGPEITYLQFWTAGKGVDMTTHNHAMDPNPLAPAFAEVHWVFNNGTGDGGMYLTPEPGSVERTRFPIVRGQEHGPFFDIDGNRPKLLENGAVSYPWHSWQAGTDDEPGQTYDFVAAFEITPDYAIL